VLCWAKEPSTVMLDFIGPQSQVASHYILLAYHYDLSSEQFLFLGR
jgi:hypothetical protein